MAFQQIADALNIAAYPPDLEGYYPVPLQRREELCSLTLIDCLQNQLDLFGCYYPDVVAGFLDLEKEPLRKACMDAYSLYIKDHGTEDARQLQCPPLTGSLGSNMFGVLIHLPTLEVTCRRYVNCGFSVEEIASFLGMYKFFLREVKEFRHGFVGFTPDIARWLTYCTKGEMYYPGTGGFYFQTISLPKETTPILLKNRIDGQVIPVFAGGQRIHRSGIPLDSEGAEDPEGSYETVFQETGSDYSGNPVRDCKVVKLPELYDKENWELIFAPEADAISMHVFFEADLAPDAVARSVKTAWDIASRAFPDKKFKAIYCSSWLLHPAVSEILDYNSRIYQFASGFVKYPSKSGAKAVFHYAFPGEYATLKDLPEESRLQKGLKERILNGAYIHDTSGLMLL